MARLIKTDGTQHEVVPQHGAKVFALTELQAMVGGYIDIERLPKSCEVMVVNDMGKLEGLPTNAEASRIWLENYSLEEFPINNDANRVKISVTLVDNSLDLVSPGSA